MTIKNFFSITLFFVLLNLIETSQNPFKFLEKSIEIDGEVFYYFDITHFEQLSNLPFSIRVLLESAIRNCDNFHINEGHVTTILNWVNSRICSTMFIFF